MKYEDSNKHRREFERRILQRDGWEAVWALKNNGSWYWKWINPKRKKAYSRQEAFTIAWRSLSRQGLLN
jgi:hypothetical protein